MQNCVSAAKGIFGKVVNQKAGNKGGLITCIEGALSSVSACTGCLCKVLKAFGLKRPTAGREIDGKPDKCPGNKYHYIHIEIHLSINE